MLHLATRYDASTNGADSQLGHEVNEKYETCSERLPVPLRVHVQILRFTFV